jgi:hypothetical protein
VWFGEASGADYAPAVRLTPRGVPYARFRNKSRDIGATRSVETADRGPVRLGRRGYAGASGGVDHVCRAKRIRALAAGSRQQPIGVASTECKGFHGPVGWLSAYPLLPLLFRNPSDQGLPQLYAGQSLAIGRNRKAPAPAAFLLIGSAYPSGRAQNLPNFTYLPPAYLAEGN